MSSTPIVTQAELVAKIEATRKAQIAALRANYYGTSK